MKPFSKALQESLKQATVSVPEARPRILFGADKVQAVRGRATKAFRDGLAQRAREAGKNEKLFGPKPEIPYLCQPIVRTLADAAFILEDEKFAARALEGIEVMFALPAGEWVARPHRPMRCDHAMLNVASTIGISTDFCSAFWSEDTIKSMGERINDYTVARFLETWEKKDAHWADPAYHWNWKIMCCGEMGTAALTFAEEISDLEAVLAVSLEGCLDVLDFAPPEGDWPEGPGYWMGTLGHGLKFGLGLHRATGGVVDLFEHPALKKTGDYIVHVTEPDGGVYDFNDNGKELGVALHYLTLLATRHQRGDWARIARAGTHESVERLAWDDPSLEEVVPEETSRSFPTTGVVTMRSGWDANATFVGLKSASSDVGHSQLDANSFVVTSRGQRLLIDEGIWPYGHDHGFFDKNGPRFHFDANGTIGHNTLMVDGLGQKFGPEYSGKIVSFTPGVDVDVAVGDATAAYGGKLTRYLRTLAYVKPDVLLVFDQVTADEPRLLEWLFHHRAEVSGDEKQSRFTLNGVTLTLSRILPEEAECWRTSDVVRASSYTESNGYLAQRVEVRYRSLGSFHPCTESEVLWAIHVGDSGEVPQVEATLGEGKLTARVRLANGQERTVELGR